jgi:hypothetical protein
VITDIVGNTARPDHESTSVSDQSDSGVAPSPSLSFDKSTGWIIAEHATNAYGRNITHLCWLPVELRSEEFDTHESMIVVASDSSYQLTIIDFEPMLNMLRRLGVLS